MHYERSGTARDAGSHAAVRGGLGPQSAADSFDCHFRRHPLRPEGNSLIPTTGAPIFALCFILPSPGFRRRCVKGLPVCQVVFPQPTQRWSPDGELLWPKVGHHASTVQCLHNPRYAGAFVYGRTRERKDAARNQQSEPSDKWLLCCLAPIPTSPGRIIRRTATASGKYHALGPDRRKISR